MVGAHRAKHPFNTSSIESITKYKIHVKDKADREH